MTLLARTLALAVLIAASLGPCRADAPRLVTIFAASSLSDVLEAIREALPGAERGQLRLSFAASSTLAKQIEQGLSADIYLSADEAWMDYLEKRGLLAHGTRRSLLGGSLVVVVPADRAIKLDIRKGGDWLDRLPRGRIATGDPEHVPAGRYAKAALEGLGVWQSVRPRLARADNVRSALVLVERGEAVAGIVYATDVRVARHVAIAGRFPDGSYPPVSYPIAIVRGRDNPAVRAVYDFILSPRARAIFTRYGFDVR
jgi:molybdate transport system substrate-binding protein